MINDILRAAVQNKASDVHITVGAPPLFRVNTVMAPSDFPIITHEGSLRLLKEILPEKRFPGFEELRDADFSYEIPGVGRFRVNAHYQRKSIAIANEGLVPSTTRSARSSSSSSPRSAPS